MRKSVHITNNYDYFIFNTTKYDLADPLAFELTSKLWYINNSEIFFPRNTSVH